MNDMPTKGVEGFMKLQHVLLVSDGYSVAVPLDSRTAEQRRLLPF